ncbi:hypothetical protein FA95DRAFT_1580191 [Auriscalpium vulgare]|uniref:Uncharacterized protein n=1 Tax=Auriscalpium vulgare TaxID=40419 RepID=A0ACB8S6F7_9AGAM|nr:hypothetical protein FA95DRAFT_1580191 [Auriscalpium vulgare]
MLAASARLAQPVRTLKRQIPRRYGSARHVSDVVKEAEPAAPTIPPLQRPLGIPEVPTTAAKSWSQKSKDFLNQEKQLEKRRHLVKEASTGYFYDLHMTRVHGGKTWMAPNVLIREDKALYFPNIMGNRLDNGEQTHTTHLFPGKVTVVAMLSTKISELHAKSYVRRVNEEYSQYPTYQYMQINLQENVLKSILVNLFLTSLRRNIPTHLQPTYIVSRQNMEYVREQLGMINSRIGYVYLVDEKMRVRWAACADAKNEEEQALIRGVGVLLKRHTKKGMAVGAKQPPELSPSSTS